MTSRDEIWEALRAHLNSMHSGDAAGHAASVTLDLSC
jgi:hypothetical protein